MDEDSGSDAEVDNYNIFSAAASKQQKDKASKSTVRTIPIDEEARRDGGGSDEVLVEVREATGGEASDDDTEPITFKDLGLSDWLTSNCAELGMKKPSLVQKNCIPQILKGKDVMGTAETGSGKTAAFALPILQALAEDPYGV
jgi:ATP-dependent RNA helicase DDX49/DBP8